MNSRIFGLGALIITVSAFLAGCGKQPPRHDPVSKQNETSANIDPGGPLYPAKAAPVYAAVVGGFDPFVMPNCVVQYEERQVVSAELDGTLEFFATPFKPGELEKLTADQRKEWVVYHPRDLTQTKPMKRIRDGMPVEAGQIVAFMDDRLVTTKMESALKIKDYAEEAKKFATEGVNATQQKYELTKKISQTAGSTRDLLDDQVTLSRFRENYSQAQQAIAKADADYKEAVVLLGRHQIRSGVNGFIRTISKRPGEYVKASEKIMEIEATDRVRLEGQLDVQYVDLARVGTQVTVEPALPSAPLASHSGHRQAVTGVAVTSHPDGPLVVSVGADGGALVWDPNLGKKANRPVVPHNLPHPVGVKSVATSPVAAKATLVITGGDDGKIRIWDVASRNQLPTTPKAELEESHTSSVQAIAFSPNGEYFATSGGRDVFMWSLAGPKKLYTLPLEHRDSVTALHFTPQNTLITASKDGTIKVWRLGTEQAAVIRTLDHRAGAVDVLGVSSDGARLLFDQDKGRIDLVDPANAQTVGQVQNIGSAGAFSTLAIFGADDIPAGTAPENMPPYTIATAGGDGDLKGVLQIWQAARRGGRASEVGRLIAPARVPITTAAFSPVRNERFLVVGTATGSVHVWKPPSEARKTHFGTIVNIDATDTRYVTVRVELSNTELKLLDRSIANVIINVDR